MFDGAGAESIAGGDEDLEVILEEEEGELGEVCGFADAVDADDGDYVGAWFRGERVHCGRVGDGCDGAEEVERSGGREDFA